MILALETTFGTCATALYAPQSHTLLAHRRDVMAKGQAERLPDMVQETMEEARVGFSDLSRLAITQGPGSFTGIRVGLSFAQGLAAGLAIEIVGVGAVSAFAHGAWARRPLDQREGLDGVLVALDMKRSTVYAAFFPKNVFDDPHDLLQIKGRPLPLEEALSTWEGPRILVCGTASPHWQGARPDCPIAQEPAFLPAPSLALLGACARPDGSVPTPLYWRGADAKLPSLRIVPTVDADLGALCALHALVFPDPWGEDALRTLLRGTENVLWSAHGIGGDVLGFLALRHGGGEGEILTLAVAPQAQGLGVGTALVKQAQEWADRSGVGALFLEVSKTNAKALTLYCRCGFAEVGLRPAYYAPRPEGVAEDRDALVLKWEGGAHG